jgi:hypothetical protein
MISRVPMTQATRSVIAAVAAQRAHAATSALPCPEIRSSQMILTDDQIRHDGLVPSAQQTADRR